jgi:pseudouridine-5'-phosphate glycosidase
MSSRGTNLVIRAGRGAVALESTLLVHGVPRPQAVSLARDLGNAVREAGAVPALVGIVGGRPIVGMTDDELQTLLDATEAVPKANASNLGLLLHRGSHGATTVSATMELAAAAGLQVFATGALGGVHRGFARTLDISSDLVALTRFPIAVVTSGVKLLLDVAATREALETQGTPVVGYQTSRFPAFYRRACDDGAADVDARFDDFSELAAFAKSELARTGRGIVVANPIPAAHEISAADWQRWLSNAESEANAAGVVGRAVTPFVLARLHEVSGGATLSANIALAKSNASQAGAIAARIR